MKLDSFSTTSVTKSGLQAYIGGNVEKLLVRAIMRPDSMRFCQVQPGCKPGSNPIIPLTTSIALKDTTNTCEFDATSEQSVTRRSIVAATLGSHVKWCNKTFLSQELAWKVRTSALGYEDIPFIETLTSNFIDEYGVKVDAQLWTGDTSGTDIIDGFKTILEAAGSGAIAYSWDSTKTLWQNVQGLILTAPQRVLKNANQHGKVRIFMSPARLTALALDLVNANLYHWNVQNGETITELTIPGTGIVATAVVGLDGQTDMFLGASDNFIIGVDMVGDEQSLDIWYSDDDRNVKAALESTFGVQVAFPAEIAFTTGA